MAEEEKKNSGAGKFILGAALGAIAGAIAGKFISKKPEEEIEGDYEEGCECGDDRKCKDGCECKKTDKIGKEAKKKSDSPKKG